MIVTNVYRPAQRVASIEVTVEGVRDDHDNAAVGEVAMDAANETPASLFGFAVQRHDGGTATVRLHRD